MKRISLVVLFCSLLVSFVFAVNAPIQDFYHYDIRSGMNALYASTSTSYANAPGALNPVIRNTGNELMDLIELAVAKNTDASVALGNPEAVPNGIHNFTRIRPNWNEDAAITWFELAVMAVKILGYERNALELYPMMSPSFTDISQSVVPAPLDANSPALFNNRAFGYVEYYNNQLQKQMGLPLMDLPVLPVDLIKGVNRLDAIQFVVRLALAKSIVDPTVEYFEDVRAFLSDDLKNALALDINKPLSIVDFALAMNGHLNNVFGWNNANLINQDIGFVYAFENFFLSKEHVFEVSPEYNTQNELINRGLMYVPIIMLDEFRIYATGPNTYAYLGRFADNGTYTFDRNLFLRPGTPANVPLVAERFWTVALFSKIFNTAVEKVGKGAYAPGRKLNNVVVYEKLEKDMGQVAFGHFEAEEAKQITDIDMYDCSDPNVRWPNYLDPADPSNSPKLRYFVYSHDNGEFSIVTDMTTWNIEGSSNLNSTMGLDFYKYDFRGNSNAEKTYRAYGTYDADSNMLLNTKILYANPSDAPSTDEAALLPYQFPVTFDQFDAFKAFIPTAKDFVTPGSLLEEIVQDILFRPNVADSSPFVVKNSNVSVSNLVDCEAVMFDVNFTHPGQKDDIVEFVYANDRLNHQQATLTLKEVRLFLEEYLGKITQDPTSGVVTADNSVVMDRIDALNQGKWADTPMLAYYWHMYRTLTENGVPESAKLVAMVITTPVASNERISAAFSNFRTAEQFYGEVRALERYDFVNANAVQRLLSKDGTVIISPDVTTNRSTSGYEVYPVIKEACVGQTPSTGNNSNTIMLDKIEFDCGTAAAKINSCCVHDLNIGDFVTLFDPFVNYQFVFPGNVHVAEFDNNQNFTGTITAGADSFLMNLFGFNGLKVETLIVSRNLDPVEPLLSQDSSILLKAYQD